MKAILQRDAPVLREMSDSVPPKDVMSPKIQRIIREMKEALASQEDGVAIAAPQIGYSLRIFVVSSKVLKLINKTKKTDPVDQDMVFINPVLIKLSKEKRLMEEGCLSVRFLYGKVSRSSKASVEAFDETGKKLVRGGSGLLAQIFQHEIDHLNGILFIDKAKNLDEIIPAHIKRNGNVRK